MAGITERKVEGGGVDPWKDAVVEREVEGGGVRSTRGTILMVVPLVASRCSNLAKSSGPLSRT